jgi:peptidoglycan hydrolase CwlO-like protein
MGNSITYVQSVAAMSAAESAQGKMESGADKVQNGEQKRKELQRTIKDKQEEVERLSAELKDASDTNAFESFCNWIVGSDNGVGDLQDAMQTAAAEMKKAQNEVMAEQVKIEMMLQELQSAQSELGQRTVDRDKTYEDNQRAAQLAQS